MSQTVEKYERLVVLAGWLWMRIRDGEPLFRRSDLLHVEGLRYFGEVTPGSRKAFEHAKKDLESFGIVLEWDENTAVEADTVASGAYRVSGLKLTPEQQRALVGLAFTVAYRDLETEEALRIPGAFLDGAGDSLLLEANRFVTPVSEAIDEQRCIRFLYKDETAPRAVQPIRLGYERGTWYLAAYEFIAQKTKVFRLDRIQSLDRSERPWSDAHDTEAARQTVVRARDRFFWGEGEIRRVVLAVDRDAELSARRLLSDLELIGEDPSGRLLLSRDYSNQENMLDVALTLGRRVEILEPADLRREMIDRLISIGGVRT